MSMKAKIPGLIHSKFSFGVYERTQEEFRAKLIELSDELREDWIEWDDDPKPSREKMREYVETYLAEYASKIEAATVVTIPEKDIDADGFIRMEDVPRWMLFGSRNTYGLKKFVLPTEVIVRKWGQVVIPDMGRAWECGTVVVKDEVTGERTMYTINSCRMLQWLDIPFDRVHVMEEWWDGGDDGHTDYRLMGLRIIDAVDYEMIECAV